MANSMQNGMILREDDDESDDTDCDVEEEESEENDVNYYEEPRVAGVVPEPENEWFNDVQYEYKHVGRHANDSENDSEGLWCSVDGLISVFIA